MLRGIFYRLLVTLVFLFGNRAWAEEPVAQTTTEQVTDSTAVKLAEAKEKGGFNAGEMIIDHISDSHEWHFFTFTKSDGTELNASICLPVIILTPGEGISIFSFKKLYHTPYKQFTLDEKNSIIRTDGKSFYDFSLTKNVIQMMIAAALLLIIFISIARNFKNYGSKKAPRGLGSAMEVVVIFIRDGVARPMLGKRANKYLPYLLTLFFFIWVNNLLGLIPGSANVTGNIAVTMTLAAFTFILMMVGSKKHFWKHMIMPPGVPPAVLPILIPIEFISNIIVKPFALMIRLFANMLAGHLIVLSFMAIIFIFAAMHIVAGLGATIFSVAFSIFIYILELLVAALQAYIFTILTALFIGETGVVDNHRESHH